MTSVAFISAMTALGKTILPYGASLWLYGSRARGTAKEDSDWDLLILLDKEKREITDFDAYSAPLMELGFENEQVVMPQIYTRKEWEKCAFTPYAKNVEQDKIVLI